MNKYEGTEVKQQHQQKYYSICLACAILFTLADFGVCMVDNTLTKNGIADSALYIPYLLLAIIILPFLCFASWALYIGFYVYRECESQRIEGNVASLLIFFISVAITVLLGVGGYNRAVDLVYYITRNKNLLDGLLDCIAIKLWISVGWIFCFMGCVMLRKLFRMKGKLFKKIIVCMCVCLCACGLVHFEKSKENYIYTHTETVWVQKMIDYYEENGMGMDVEPFSRN